MLCDGKLSLGWREYIYADNHCILGQKVLNQLRPLDKAEIARVEILLVSHIKYLLDTIDTIEVEVIYHVALGGTILINQRKCRTCHRISRAQMLHNCADKCGFTGTHSATKRHHIAAIKRFYNRLGNLFQSIK